MTISAFLLVAVAFAGGPEQRLQKVLDGLRTAPGFHSPLVKKVHQDLEGKDVESSGDIYFSKGKMRLEFEKPEKILLVYDGRTAWQEQEYDDGDSKHAIVTKMSGGHLKNDSAPLAILLGEVHLFKTFKLSKHQGAHYELVPKNKKMTEVKVLKIDLDGDTLKSIAYKDDLDNEVLFIFDRLKIEKVSADKFHYEPPKGAEVNSL